MRNFSSMRFFLGAAIFVSFSLNITAQSTFKEKFSYRGYIKDMRILSFANDSSKNTQSVQQNLLHHRLNTRFQLDTSWELGVEFRNRVFYGEFLKYAPTFGDQLEVDQGILDMNWSWVNRPNVICHTALDRLWLNYSSSKWDVRLGRQRINWGQNVVWNPNDLFNVLNFTDFDYEERPGSDAFKAQRYFKNNSSLQVAYKFTNDPNEAVYAGMYRFNKKNYDFQLLAGKYHNDVALGVGWAGNIKSSGFKGESTVFLPTDDSSEQVVLTSISWDMSYGNGMYVLVSAIHNSNGVNDINQLLTLSGAAGAQPDLKSLMPNEYSLFAQASGAFTPLINGSLATIVAVDIGGVFLMPNISISLKQNLDLSIVGQSFYTIDNKNIAALSNAIFVRFKWSY